MSISSGVPQELPEPTASAFNCASCSCIFSTEDRFFSCRPCNENDVELCQTCMLSEVPLSEQYHFHPCFLDPRDDRPTFLPTPDGATFNYLVVRAKADEAFKFPVDTIKYLSKSTIVDISQERLSSPDSYSQENEAGVEATTRRVHNNYSRYEELDTEKKDIRLLQLFNGNPGEPLLALLGRFSSPWNQVPYMALSYRWGELDEIRFIDIIHLANRLHDGNKPEYRSQRLAITANLEIALQGIRLRDNRLWFWADAICINQGDLEERAYQVNIMSEIFTRASAVCIWLGLSPSEAASVKYVRALTDAVQRARRDHPEADAAQVLGGIVRHAQLSVDNQPLEHIDLAKILKNFFGNPYYHRVWVLQEVSCASSTIYVFTSQGVPPLQWMDIQNAHVYLGATFKYAKTGMTGLPTVWSDVIRDFSDSDHKSDEKSTLLELFEGVCKDFKATDPRDMLFGLLAIAMETKSMASLSHLIAPNYSKSVSRVYVDFTRWCLQQDQSLNVLGYVTYMLRDHSMRDGSRAHPSWALSHRTRFISSGQKMCLVPKFRAAADVNLAVNLLNDVSDDYVLKLKGYRLGTVDQVEKMYLATRWELPTKLILNDDSTNTYYTGVINWMWRNLLKGVQFEPERCELAPDQTVCRGQTIFDIFLQLLTCGGIKRRCVHTENQHSHEVHLLQSSDLYPIFARYWLSEGAAQENSGENFFCSHVQSILLESANTGDPEEIHELAMSANRKCVFTTTTGRIGLCPPDSRKDDIVVALFGGRSPFVLRALPITASGEQHWMFIGECFVRDYMSGSQVDCFLRSGKPSEIFLLT